MTTTTSAERRTTDVLLGNAVHKSSAISSNGVLERLFTLAFRDLVYPLIWEDPRVDLEALAIEPTSRVVTIASGGCNILSYLTANPERIFAVDLNSAHVALNRLKYAALRHLPEHDQFYSLFGHAGSPKNVAVYDQFLASQVDADTRRYWEGRDHLGRRRITQFSRGIYRYGLLGRFIKIAHLAGKLYGRDPRRMMQARTREEQIALFEAELAPLFERRLIRWILGHRAALYGLGIPPAQYDALVGDAPHMADVVCERLRKLACDFDLSDNYFAWIAFNRSFARDGHGPHPMYLDRANFEKLKARVNRVSIEHNSFTEFLANQPATSLDRYILLDAQDWMNDQDLSHLWAEITRTARPGARVIFRTAGTDTILPGRVPNAILDRWTYAEAQSLELTKLDRSAIYGGFHLYTFGG